MKKLSKITYIRYLDVKLFAMLMSGCMIAAGVKSCTEQNNKVKADMVSSGYTTEEMAETNEDKSVENKTKGFVRVRNIKRENH